MTDKLPPSSFDPPTLRESLQQKIQQRSGRISLIFDELASIARDLECHKVTSYDDIVESQAFEKLCEYLSWGGKWHGQTADLFKTIYNK
jgi:hypothetical protein